MFPFKSAKLDASDLQCLSTEENMHSLELLSLLVPILPGPGLAWCAHPWAILACGPQDQEHAPVIRKSPSEPPMQVINDFL